MTQEMSLLDKIEQRIESGEVTLPPYSTVASELQAKAAGDDFDLAEIEELIRSDPSLVAELLKVSNSPFYGGLSEITTVRSAIVRVGVKDVVNLAVMACERGRYDAFQDPQIAGYVQPLWKHAVACGFGSRWLANRLGFPELGPQAFIGGLLHDIGKLMLLWALEDLKKRGELQTAISDQLIREMLDSAHNRVGHKLAETWNLPDEYGKIIRDHHLEEFDRTDSLLMIVRLANLACAKVGIGLRHDDSIVLPASAESHELGVREIILGEMLVVLEDSQTVAA